MPVSSAANLPLPIVPRRCGLSSLIYSVIFPSGNSPFYGGFSSNSTASILTFGRGPNVLIRFPFHRASVLVLANL